VILRIWSAALDPARLEEYRRFEAERSLPMLHRQPGFLGVFFLRAAEDRAASITIWEDRGAVEALESSPSYRRTDREYVIVRGAGRVHLKGLAKLPNLSLIALFCLQTTTLRRG
jgi:hypothetical protein